MTHYIPLNGFHPLYRALFDTRPEGIALNALDNVKLFQALQWNEPLRQRLLKETGQQAYKLSSLMNYRVKRRYDNHFTAANRVLTELLPGEIEFHHTAPFPSLRRPFVFHCESFAPVFFPFAHQGTGRLPRIRQVRAHYAKLFASEECLGIFSHLPETLAALSRFFNHPLIDNKLHVSPMGVSSAALSSPTQGKAASLQTPHFLFVNSANQNPNGFFLRGGHIVLRFWKELRDRGIDGRLYMRCGRPNDAELQKYGVDPSFLKAEIGRSILWVENYLTNADLNALVGAVHFMLLPSASLHSVSIMQAMALGAVPVVTDTIGASVLVSNDVNGIALQGVRKTRWHKNPDTGIEFDRLSPDEALDADLVAQLTRRVAALLETSGAYDRVQSAALARAKRDFSGEAFSDRFWEQVGVLYERYKRSDRRLDDSADEASPLTHCLVDDSDWPRLFESPTQPVRRLYTGFGCVAEFGGAYVAYTSPPAMELHDWSPLSAYVYPSSPRLHFADSIKGLQGKFFEGRESAQERGFMSSRIPIVKRALKPFPSAYKLASWSFRHGRNRYRRLISKRQESPPELVLEGVCGYNIIRYRNRFYGILQSEGAFIYEKIAGQGYSSCFIGSTLANVRDQILVSRQSAHG
ncbi:MAG: glycosyltransferase [Deltaproteobacteria bacterium]|nr:glycosyltransferase [Deltaproteobacteria bacterium]